MEVADLSCFRRIWVTKLDGGHAHSVVVWMVLGIVGVYGLWWLSGASVINALFAYIF